MEFRLQKVDAHGDHDRQVGVLGAHFSVGPAARKRAGGGVAGSPAIGSYCRPLKPIDSTSFRNRRYRRSAPLRLNWRRAARRSRRPPRSPPARPARTRRAARSRRSARRRRRSRCPIRTRWPARRPARRPPPTRRCRTSIGWPREWTRRRCARWFCRSLTAAANFVELSLECSCMCENKTCCSLAAHDQFE